MSVFESLSIMIEHLRHVCSICCADLNGIIFVPFRKPVNYDIPFVELICISDVCRRMPDFTNQPITTAMECDYTRVALSERVHSGGLLTYIGQCSKCKTKYATLPQSAK